MYRAYAARHGLEARGAGQPALATWAGSTRPSFLVKGDGVWSRLKHEAGPHRVQRVPVTESPGRIHTSSATVTVLPEAEEVDVDIDPNDLQIDVYRSSGPGGQSRQHHRLRGAHHPQADRHRGHRCRTRRASSRTGPRPWRSCAPACSRPSRTAAAAERLGARRGQVGGGGRVREDPDLQLQGEPRHRPPHRAHPLQARPDPGAVSWTRSSRRSSPTSGPGSCRVTADADLGHASGHGRWRHCWPRDAGLDRPAAEAVRRRIVEEASGYGAAWRLAADSPCPSGGWCAVDRHGRAAPRWASRSSTCSAAGRSARSTSWSTAGC